MPMPLVTVIIPTYNRAKLVGRAIRSVLVQTHRDFELLIVDDGSTDDTPEVVSLFADPRIVYIRHEQNQGQCAAINTGLRAAKGDYIAFLDSDDEWLPPMLEKQLEVFERSDEKPGVVYALSGARNADGSLTPSRFNTLRGDIYKEALAQGYVAPSITLLVRKEGFGKVGLFDTRFTCFQDDDICFRLAKEYRFDFVPEILAVVHMDAASQLTRDRAAYARGWWDLVTKHEADIRRECGEAVLAGHCFKAGKLFLEARQMEEARRAFAQAYTLQPSPRNLIYGILTRLPPPVFQAVWEGARRVWRLVRSSLARETKTA